jgi:hypothetical protein
MKATVSRQQLKLIADFYLYLGKPVGSKQLIVQQFANAIGMKAGTVSWKLQSFHAIATDFKEGYKGIQGTNREELYRNLLNN